MTLAAVAAPPPLTLTPSRDFAAWLRRERLSLALTTYQSHRLLLIGTREDGALSAFERTFEGAMGLHAARDRLVLATKWQLWELHDAGAGGGYDALYVPRVGWVTGELEAHDVAVDAHGPVFVNTRYSCLARPSPTHSFEPLWRPKFISRLAPEDRCHLNGLAMRAGAPAFVTAISRSDVAAGWRERRADGGVLVDVASGEIAASGLSMPHSPRWHGDAPWLLNSGTGEIGRVDLARGAFEPLAFVPGYARGLAFHGRWAVVGLSKPRDQMFGGLSLQQRLQEKDAVARCGVRVIDTATGDTVHWLDIDGAVGELYDVQVLPGVLRPRALGFRTPELRQCVTFVDAGGSVVQQIPAADDPEDTASPPSAHAYRVQPASTLGALRRDFAPLLWPRGPAMELPAETSCIAVLATQGSEAVGMAVALPAEDRIARVVSLVVDPAHRRRGIALELLQHVEAQALRANLASVAAAWRTHWPGIAALEALLARAGWLPPAAQMIRCRAPLAKLEAHAWVHEPLPALPPGIESFPWGQLTQSRRARIEESLGRPGSAPREMNPFQMPRRLDAACSFGLRRGDGVLGWAVCHRLRPQTVQTTALYVAPELRRTGAAWVLARQVVRAVCAQRVPSLVWELRPDNAQMVRAMERELGALVESRSEVRTSGKVVGVNREVVPA